MSFMWCSLFRAISLLSQATESSSSFLFTLGMILSSATSSRSRSCSGRSAAAFEFNCIRRRLIFEFSSAISPWLKISSNAIWYEFWLAISSISFWLNTSTGKRFGVYVIPVTSWFGKNSCGCSPHFRLTMYVPPSVASTVTSMRPPSRLLSTID